jgi:DNA ligase-1
LDGLRIQAHIEKSKIWLFSRGLENVTNMYPDIVEGLKKQVHEECILDGEMIAVDKRGKYLPFQETVQRKRKYDILEMMESVPLKYYVFDVLFADGISFLDKPNQERWKKLEEVVEGNEVVRLMPRKIVKSETEIEKFFKESLAEGTEGIFVKKLDGTYRSGSRDFNWIKYKKSYDETGVADTIDAVVLGYDRGEGKRSGFGIGGFLIGVWDEKKDKLLTVAKIGTGLTDEEWRKLKIRTQKLEIKTKPENFEVEKQMNCDVWVRPEIVVEIKCDEITKSPMHTSGYALRFPRLVSFREMKVADIATKAEVERLFNLQRGGGSDGK